MNESPTPSAKRSRPVWIHVLNVVFLLWNLLGLMAFVLSVAVLNNREALAEAGLNEAQSDMTLAMPAWVTIAFGIAVVAGSLGTLGLLIGSRLATPILIVSLVAVLVQNTYVYFLSDAVAVMGVGLSPLVIVVAIILVPYSIFCND